MRQLFPDVEWKTLEGSADLPPLLRGLRDGEPILAAIQSLPTLRIPDLLGRLAWSVLELRALPSPEPALILVEVDRFGEQAIQAAARFMHRQAPELGWGLVDRSGNARIFWASQGIEATRAGEDAPAAPSRGSGAHLFTDLNRWMLKILLLSGAPPAWWSGPRERPLNPTDLGRIAGVSTPKAHSFFHTFERAGFLRRQREGLRIARAEGLLHAWLADELSRPPQRIPARSLFGEPSSALLSSQLDPERFAIGGFEACRRLDLLHTPGDVPALHIRGSAADALRTLDLDACEMRDASVVLVLSPYPESVFRGARRDARGPVVDVIQAALDVRPLANRGLEQSEFLVSRILSWVEHDR